MVLYTWIYAILGVVFWISFMYYHSRKNHLSVEDVWASLAVFGFLWIVFIPFVGCMAAGTYLGEFISDFFNCKLKKNKG